MKARKKPVVVDVWPIAIDNSRNMPQWVLEAFNKAVIRHSTVGHGLVVDTAEGMMMGEYGDILIKGVAGELYPCKRRIFDATYDVVPE